MTTCIWRGRDEPRGLLDHHELDCADEECRGCQPCIEAHCRVCQRAHVEQTCAECQGATRDDLRTIAAMCDALSDEVLHRGTESEAMVLLGPAADPEAWGHMTASVRVGRLPESYLAAADDEHHPLFVLGSWEMVWRDHLEQPTALRATLPRLVDYLDRQMHVMAAEPLVPFEDFARDLRQCRSHLEVVLHDGEQRDTGAPCMTCGVPLVREWGLLVAADGWRCPRCREFSTDDQYRFAVAHLHRKEATHLTDRDCAIRTGVKAGTIRSWAAKGYVERRRDSERTVYSVADVMEHAERAGLVS
jgi:hypothetical protein